MIEPLGKPCHREAFGGPGHLVCCPPDRFGDLDGRESLCIGFLQCRVGARDLLDAQIGDVATQHERRSDERQQDQDEDSDEDFLADGHSARFYGSARLAAMGSRPK